MFTTSKIATQLITECKAIQLVSLSGLKRKLENPDNDQAKIVLDLTTKNNKINAGDFKFLESKTNQHFGISIGVKKNIEDIEKENVKLIGELMTRYPLCNVSIYYNDNECQDNLNSLRATGIEYLLQKLNEVDFLKIPKVLKEIICSYILDLNPIIIMYAKISGFTLNSAYSERFPLIDQPIINFVSPICDLLQDLSNRVNEATFSLSEKYKNTHTMRVTFTPPDAKNKKKEFFNIINSIFAKHSQSYPDGVSLQEIDNEDNVGILITTVFLFGVYSIHVKALEMMMAIYKKKEGGIRNSELLMLEMDGEAENLSNMSKTR